ncbi:MAG: hypothetical protein IT436_05155 [Phycisphaerales bacterium]|nr:hypothetical protein [Phycisphaerales bacterium]
MADIPTATRLWISGIIMALGLGTAIGYATGVVSERERQAMAQAAAEAARAQAEEDAKWIPLFRIRNK